MTSRFAISPQKRIYYGGILFFALFISLFLFPSGLFIQLGVLFIGIVLFFLFLFNLELGLYILIGTSIFYGWEIYFSQYEALKNISYLAAINAPLVDLVTLLLGLCTGFAWFFQFRDFQIKKLLSIKYIILAYALFIGWGILATLYIGHGGEGSSIKYLLRPMLFAFLGFVVLPTVLIQKKEVLVNCLKVAFWTGIVTALFGLSSVIVAPQAGWIRITPYGIGNFAPLGYNHNMIAEALVIFIPVAAYLALDAYRQKKASAKWYMIGGLLMSVIALLTLSRAAWIALVIEAGLAIFFFKNQVIEYVKKRKFLFIWLMLIVGMAIVGYMGVFLTSSVVSSSNSARWQMVDITVFYARRSPWFGYGPGTYIDILASTADFVTEHGDPVDSHGFVQKIILEEGVVGFGLFSVAVLLIFYHVRQAIVRALQHQYDALVLQSLFIMMVGGVVFQLFDTSYFKSVMWLPMGLGIAASFLETKTS